MFKVIIALTLASIPDGTLTFEHHTRFDTERACKDALPQLEADAEAVLSRMGLKRGAAYDFTLLCEVAPDPDKV